jgi:hypothetical protein
MGAGVTQQGLRLRRAAGSTPRMGADNELPAPIGCGGVAEKAVG